MNVALCPEHIDILSLCTGGAGLDLGVELAIPSARTVCMVEREAFAVAHLVSAMEQGLLHPAPIWSDARTFDGRAWRGCVDGIIGGIPCQPHSLAGKRLGKDDERDLWSPARRIVVQSGAWFVLIENVGGMLSSGGAERVWRDFRRLGFAVEGGLFTAKEVRASHERERLFILAVADALCGVPDTGRSRSIQGARSAFEREARQQDGQWRRDDAGDSGECVDDPNCERLEGQRSDARAIGRQDARRSAGLRSRTALVDAYRPRRSPPRSGHPLDATEQPQPGYSAMVNATRDGCRKGWSEPELSERDRPSTDLASAPMDDTARGFGNVHARPWQDRLGEAYAGGAGEGLTLFPPGPSDFDSWRRVLEHSPDLEPAIRRMADGVASRVDQLRMLGNRVVCLEAAHALRTLATRLAARGSVGANRLVRMMAE